MTTKRDFYDILGVSKSASQDELKKAYRKQALQWHPDCNKTPEAAEKFKEVNEAYEVLGNPQKRQTYDQFGQAAFSQGGQSPFTYSYTYGGGNEGFSRGAGPGSAWDFSDPFDIFEQFFGGASPFRQAAQKPRYGLSLTFQEAAKGVEKEVSVEGKRKKIKIPAGVDEGSRIEFNDFYITVDVKSDKIFQREGYDVYVNQELTLKMAILGGIIEVPTIDGNLKLRIRPGTQSGSMVRLAGRGIKKLQGYNRGNQYVRLLVKIPEKLTRKQKDILEEFE